MSAGPTGSTNAKTNMTCCLLLSLGVYGNDLLWFIYREQIEIPGICTCTYCTLKKKNTTERCNRIKTPTLHQSCKSRQIQCRKVHEVRQTETPLVGSHIMLEKSPMACLRVQTAPPIWLTKTKGMWRMKCANSPLLFFCACTVLKCIFSVICHDSRFVFPERSLSALLVVVFWDYCVLGNLSILTRQGQDNTKLSRCVNLDWNTQIHCLRYSSHGLIVEFRGP